MPRTALIVAVPEAESAVGELRLRHDRSAALGVPAHLTILFPFVDSGALDEDAVEAVFSAHEPFDFELESPSRPSTAVAPYLAPSQADRFVALTESVWRRWPDHPPYEGAHEAIVPHLTNLRSSRSTATLQLPIHAHAGAVTLIEEQADGCWVCRRRFALHARPA